MREHLVWAAQADLHGLGDLSGLRLPTGKATRLVALVVGIDTGGTFTDMVVLDTATGRVESLKTSSMPSSPGQAIVNALDEGERRRRRASRRSRTGRRSGRTPCIERTGCKVAFVTTKGFEDTPFIQRINRKVLYDLRWRKPEPLVAQPPPLPRARRAARTPRAQTLRPVDEAEVRALVPHDPRGRRRGGRAGAPVLLRQHRARGSGSSGSSRRSCRDCRSPSPTRWRRSGASTSARRRRSPTPTCARCSAATSASLDSGAPQGGDDAWSGR